MATSPPDPCRRGGKNFRETRWTWISAVRSGDEAARTVALQALCLTYRLPLYCFARRRGLNPEDANDVVQECLLEVIRRDAFAKANPAKGRLRTFLLMHLEQQIANWQRRERARKRGGGRPMLSWEQDAEEFYGREPVNEDSPDKYFARAWARALADGVLDDIRASWVRRGPPETFDALRPFVFERLENADTLRLAAELQLSVANVRVKLHRLRKEFATNVRAHVSETVMNHHEIDDEIHELGVIFQPRNRPDSMRISGGIRGGS